MTFATTKELAFRLGRDFTASETVQAEELLDAATVLLREVMGGAHVYPRTTVSVPFVVHGDDRWVDLPQQPVVEVTSVSVDGSQLDDSQWQLVDSSVYLHSSSGHQVWKTVEVDFTYGYFEVPDDLREYCLVLAAQMLSTVDDTGSMSNVGVQSRSETIDDWSQSVTYETGAAAGTSMELPRRTVDRLRARYGKGSVASVGSRWP